MGFTFEFDEPKPKRRKTIRASRKPKQDVPVFMEFVNVVWNARFPGCKPPPESVKCLRGVYEALGDEEATNRLRRYLHESPARFVSLHRFAQTHAEWAEEAPKGEFRPLPRAEYREGRKQPQKGAESLGEALRRVNPSPPTTVTVPVVVDPVTGRLRPV